MDIEMHDFEMDNAFMSLVEDFGQKASQRTVDLRGPRIECVYTSR
jgi:hypothetical protein